MSSRDNEEVKLSPHDPQRGFGDNGGPNLKKLTAKGKVERIKEVLDMDISAAQKCIGIRIIADADADGITPELSTDDLKRAASVKDRKTVYTATKKLEGKKVAKPIQEDGRPNRYLVLQDEAIDAVLDDMDAPTSAAERHGSSAVERQCHQTAVPSDGSAVEHQCHQTALVPVPLNGTTLPLPVPPDGTTPVPLNGTSAAERHGTSAVERHIRERESNKREREKGSAVVEVNCEAIYGPGFTLDFGAIDMAAGLSGVPIERARQIAEICARDWAANGVKPSSPMAMVKRAIASDRNHKQTDDARTAAAAKNTPASKRDRIAQWAREEEERIKSEKSKWSTRT